MHSLKRRWSLLWGAFVAVLLLPVLLVRPFPSKLPAATAVAAVPTLTPLPTQTRLPTATQPSTRTETATATVHPAELAAVVETAVPTTLGTAVPSPTPTVVPTATHTPTGPPPWLTYLNQFRAMSGLPLLTESAALSAGSLAHSEYMARNDNAIARSENSNNPFFTEAGRSAAWNGNIYATNIGRSNYQWAINFWMSAPFHALPMLDPTLRTVGYGNFRDDLGSVQVAAVLDVNAAPRTPSAAAYPIPFPPDGGETWVLQQTLIEYPEPLSSCAGWRKPAGPPLILQLGDGSLTPQVTNFSLTSGGVSLPVCAFDETSYSNPDEFAQERGRRILDAQDAVVLIPQAALAVGQTYTAQVTVNGETHSWSFTAVSPPPLTAEPIPLGLPVAFYPININGFAWGGQTHDFENMPLMQSMGMGWLKFQQKWRPDSQPEELAARIQQARAAGFKVVVSLTGDPYPAVIDFDAFVTFVAGVAALDPPPNAIEIWNEMNIDFEWPPGQIDPAQYVEQMLKPSYLAIKAANPNITVISGAPASTGFDNGVNAWAVDRYLAGMVAAGAANYLDCVGVHYNEAATSPYADSGHPAGDYYLWYYQPSLQMVYFSFGGARPLCITELGVLSPAGYPPLPGRFWWAAGTTPEEQAQWLADALTIANQSGYVRLAIVFNVDIFHWEADPQGGFAIVRPGGGCPFCELILRQP